MSVITSFCDAAITWLDHLVRALAEEGLGCATTLATLNCQLAERVSSDDVWGDCYSTLGWLYERQGKLEPAALHYHQALDIFATMPKTEAQKAIADIRFRLGKIIERQYLFEGAIDEYTQALELAQQLECSQLASDIQNSLGGVYLALGRADDALVAFESALELSQQIGDRRGEEAALGNLGLVYRFLGHLTKAEDYHRQALAISREIPHWSGTVRHLNHLGSVLLELRESDEAEQCFQKALDIARQDGDRRSEEQCLGNLGILYEDKAEQEAIRHGSETWLVKAEQHHREALQIARERGDPRSQANHLANLGNVYQALGRRDAAQECYETASSLAEQQNAPDVLWRVYYSWGDLCTAQGQDKPAFDHYASAIKIVEDQRDELNILSRVKFWQERSILYEKMVLCCLCRGELWPALVYTERAKARYLADLLAQHTPLEGDIQRQIETDQQRALRQSEQPSREEETEKLIEATIEALPPHTAVVVFNVTEAGTVVFIVTNQLGVSDEEDVSDEAWEESSDGRIRVTLVDGLKQDDLRRILVEVDDSYQAPGGFLGDQFFADRIQWQATLERVSTEIYDALLASVHRKLTELAIERLVLMPNLGLSLLPLHASYKSNGGERDYLMDHYEITYVPSFNLLRRCHMRATSARSDYGHLLAIVDPTSSLDWAPVEVECIARFFSTRVLDGSEENLATRQAIIAEMPDYDHVHFACHGEFNLREPMQSALTLAATSTDDPGLLTLEDVLNLKLPHTPLVVMSACETSLVDPGDLADEYLGLQGGFLKAGALNVVASLWAVDDLSTALLMSRFYHNLRCRDSPMAPAVALRLAQRWLRDCPKAEVEALLQNLRQDLETTAHLSDHVVRSVRSGMRRLKLMDDPPFSHPDWWAAFEVVGVGPYPTATEASLTTSGGSGVNLETELGIRDGQDKSNNQTALVQAVHGLNRKPNWVPAAEGVYGSVGAPTEQDLGGEAMDPRTLIMLLDEKLDDTQANLSPVEWESFSQRLMQLVPRFGEVQDEVQLEDAADDLVEACLPYAYLRGLLQEASTRKPKRPFAGPEKEPLREIINRIIRKLEESAASDQVAEESDVPVHDK